MKMWSILLAVSVIVPSLGISLRAAELPPELPLWEKESPDQPIHHEVFFRYAQSLNCVP